LQRRAVEAIPLVLRSPGYIFQQDNARSHTAFATRKHFEELAVEVLPWPARSPDLSPIEHLWDVLGPKARAEYGGMPENIAQLQERLVQQWEKLPKRRSITYACPCPDA
jgi:hypothetical protein